MVPKKLIASLQILALGLAGAGILILLRPERGVEGLYSTPGVSGNQVTIATRLV